jgi:hypothetical protein
MGFFEKVLAFERALSEHPCVSRTVNTGGLLIFQK